MRFQMLMMAGAMMLVGASPLRAADPGNAACSAPDQPLRPVMATHTMPPYPDISVMTGEQGNTLVQVSIGPDGVPTKASVVKSSGSVRLDQASMDHIKNNWRWNAPVKGCKPVATDTQISVTWNLKNAGGGGPQPPTIFMNVKDYPPDALQKHEQGTVVMLVMVTTIGQVVAVVMQSSGFPDLDQRSAEVARGWHWGPATLDGRPVNTTLFVNSVWKLDDGH